MPKKAETKTYYQRLQEAGYSKKDAAMYALKAQQAKKTRAKRRLELKLKLKLEQEKEKVQGDKGGGKRNVAEVMKQMKRKD